ncbi:MAG: low-complexity tail membrane protein [Vulcanococcus sp.]
MTSPQGNPARREPLLWLQLLGLAALPLEVAGLLLLLAGADPGPLPGLERLFCWALGALAPAVLFWRLPPDLWSLLLVQVPLKGRRPDQLRLSALQDSLPLKLLSAAGALPLLPLLWWADNRAGLAWAWSPLASSPRLVVLLAGASLLSLLLWQWQQIIQALWMVSRPATAVAQTLPLSLEKAGDTRLCIGLPLLLLAPLEPEAPPPAAEAQRPEADAATPQPSASSVDTSAVGDAGPVAPEQGAEQAEGADLDQQV